jgi:hypothetical protein
MPLIKTLPALCADLDLRLADDSYCGAFEIFAVTPSSSVMIEALGLCVVGGGARATCRAGRGVS